MRVDQVLRDPRRSLQELLRALASNLTARDNFAPEGESGQFLRSNGSARPPSYQDADVPSTSTVHWEDVEGTPRTLEGYDIVDAYGKNEIDTLLANYYTKAEVDAMVDTYISGETLADQVGAGAVLTFTFANGPVDLLWVFSDGEDARADPFGGTPTASAGIPCDDGVPQPVTVRTSEVKVFAPAGATVSVWGYRY